MRRTATVETPEGISSANSGSTPAGKASSRQATPGQPPHKRQHTIRYRLAWLVLVCVVPVWLTAGFLVYSSYREKRSEMEGDVLDTARAFSMVVDRELANIQASLTALATSPSLASGNLADFHRQATLVLHDYPGGDIILGDATGQQLVNSYVPFGKPLPRRNVPESVRSIYSTGRPVISNLFRGAVTGRNLLSVDVPVFRGEQVVYDLALTIPAQRLMALFAQQRIPPEWTAGISDRNQVIVARNRFPERYVGTHINPVLAKNLAERLEGSVESTNLEGTPVVLMFSRSPRTGWTAAIGIPKAVFIADVWRSLRWAIGAVLLLSITGFGLALLLARRMAASVEALIAPALALGSGAPVDIGQLDLAETNKVGQSLLQASKLLQQRAAERERAEAVRRQAEALERSNLALQRREADARLHAAELSAIITERKAAEEAQRASEERLRLLGDNLPNSAVYQYMHEADGTPRFLYVSAGIERLSGVKAADVIRDAGALHRQFLPGELPALLEAERVSARHLSVFEREAQMRLPDGQLRWMHLLSRPRRLPDGRTVWDGVQTDITERKRAEAELKQARSQAERSAAQLRTILDNMTERLYVCDHEGKMVMLNEAARETYGVADGAVPSRFSDLHELIEVFELDSRPVPLPEWPISRILRGEHIRGVELRVRSKVTGKEFIFSYNGAPVRDADGNIVMAVFTAEDITDRKLAEKALIRSEKLASAGRMAATVAHEINNPLEAISNAVYLAWMDKSISQQAKAHLDIAVQELHRVAHLAQRTLGFYREYTTPGLVDLSGTVDSVVELFAPRLRSRGIAIEKRYAEVEKINAVDGEIRQIVSNLLSNSFDAMERDGRILFRIKPCSWSGCRSARFTIADTGTGIARERMAKIFEPFFTTKETVGTGLGLWVTKELVQKHGGTIRVRSKPGKGTVFSINFPIAEQNSGAAERASAVSAPRAN